ncbi:WD40-repeat-containing domain protein [Aspergillus granulosus]|uniref:WD40-repeat-containing domain protein n=1 Tax=Aspergillus granulosus TaxID=176169 RepID=A0ABR4HKY4_9EURO
MFKDDLPSWVCRLPEVNKNWSAELQTLEGHSGLVTSVAFSPNGQLLASGSLDRTVRLWDTATGGLKQTLEDTTTGGLQQTLEGHSLWVTSVAFSPNGQLLASGSVDGTVRLWDTATGGLQEALRTTGSVTELHFSQDASYISTNVGSLNIQSGRGNDISSLQKTDPGIFLKGQDWIALNNRQVLWLPPEVRPSCSAISSNTIALGHKSGRISFIGLRVD